MMAANDSSLSTEETYRRSLKLCVSAQLQNVGFEVCEKVVIESLIEILQSCELSTTHHNFCLSNFNADICEVARSSQHFCEHSGRTSVTYFDVAVALANVGFPLSSLLEYVENNISEPVGQGDNLVSSSLF